MTTPKILAFSGSLRQGSFNHQLASVAAKHAEAAGAEVRVIRLREFALPVYDGDIEAAGFPEMLEPLKEQFRWADGFLICSPEYNSSISAALKNAIDWVSRPTREGEPALEGFAGKTAGLLSASPGGLGGLRGLVHLRSILQSIKVLTVPDQFALASAHGAFAEDGSIADEKQDAAVAGVARALVELTAKVIS